MSHRYGLLEGQTIGAVVLAGGLARRMGGIDKGLVEIKGKSMVQYTLDVLEPMVDAVVVNANRNMEVYRTLGPKVVPDVLADHQGPLAGLSAGLAALGTDYIVMCPCDSPFLESELIAKLINHCVNECADIAVAHDGQRLQPVFCVVHSRVQTSLDNFLNSGERKIDRWFDCHTVVQVEASQFSSSFRNINTEEERLLAEKAE